MALNWFVISFGPEIPLAARRGAVAVSQRGPHSSGPASAPGKKQLASLWLGENLLCLSWNVFLTLKYFYTFEIHSSGPDTWG